MYCAAGWALEGFCDVRTVVKSFSLLTFTNRYCSPQSLAYEIAPYNVKLTILQCSIEIPILTNLVTTVSPIVPAYSPGINPAPLFRGILNRLVPRLPNTQDANGSHNPDQTSSIEEGPFSGPDLTSTYPPLSSAHMEVLVSETVYAIIAIGGA